MPAKSMHCASLRAAHYQYNKNTCKKIESCFVGGICSYFIASFKAYAVIVEQYRGDGLGTSMVLGASPQPEGRPKWLSCHLVELRNSTKFSAPVLPLPPPLIYRRIVMNLSLISWCRNSLFTWYIFYFFSQPSLFIFNRLSKPFRS